jgi:competence protein ComEC
MFSLSPSEKLRGLLVLIFAGLFFGQFEGGGTVFLLCGTVGGMLAIIWNKYWIWGLCAICLSVSYGQWRNDFDFRHDTLSTRVNETIELKGTVVSFPDQREKNIRSIIKTPEGRLLLIAGTETTFHYGDRIEVKGVVTKPRSFIGFDYEKHLRRFGVQTLIRNPLSVTLLEGRGGSLFLKGAEQTRLFFARNLERSLPAPHSTIAMGVLLGVKNELPEFLQNDFKRSGLQHLLVVSGFNVTVILLFITFSLGRFGRPVAFGGSVLALLFFVAMTGAEAPVLRAAIMGGIVAWAAYMGRFSDARNLVFLSMVLIGIAQPRIVQTDIGFFLSSIATLGIVLGTPVMERVLGWVPNRFELRTMLAVTLSAQIAVFPILGLYFGNFPLIGVLSNLFAEPIIPLSMVFSFGSSILGILPETIARILGIPGFILIEFLLQVAHFFGRVEPFPISRTVANVSLVLVLGFFGWASFSRWFARTFFEKGKELGSCEELKN